MNNKLLFTIAFIATTMLPLQVASFASNDDDCSFDDFDKGLDVSAPLPQGYYSAGRTPLNFILTFCPHVVTLRELIDRGADVNIKGKDKYPPLGLAVQHGYWGGNFGPEATKLLLQHGAKVDRDIINEAKKNIKSAKAKRDREKIQTNQQILQLLKIAFAKQKEAEKKEL
jgi:hypothetical protein